MERLNPSERHESIRGYFAYELYNQMVDNPNVWLVTADLGYGMWDKIKKDFPDRFINTGAAEQTALGVSVGLAEMGKIPFVYSITPFLLFRGAETIRNYINREKVAVKLIGAGRENDYEHDGFSHHNYDDKKLMEVFPNIQSCWPLTKSDMKYIVKWCADTPIPIYVNLKR
jgi:transketolase